MNINIQHILEQGEGISIELKKASNVLPESFFETFHPFPKNSHIAQIFIQISRYEELGTGLRNVYNIYKSIF